MVEARTAGRRSQEDAASALGVTRQTVSKWETGKSSPNLRQLGEMCELYGVSADWLLHGVASIPTTGIELLDKMLLARPVKFEPPRDFVDSQK